MLVLNSYVAIVVVSREGTIETWADKIGAAMVNFTRTDQVGGWVGAERVETEPGVRLATWGPDWATVSKLLVLAEEFQVEEAQEAVYLEYSSKGKTEALIIGAGDWDAARGRLADAFC